MNSFRTFQEDDENDTHLFNRLEEYVLKNHPNPDRIGCPGPGTLRAFVESPRSVDLSELNDLHIMQCAECTRDLIELRRERAVRLQGASIHAARSIRWNWKLAGVAACLLLVAFSWSVWHWREGSKEVARLSHAPDTPILASVDLSGDGVSRGTEASALHPILLPGRLLNLHLVLPYYSPSGTYRIFLARDKNTSSPIASAEGTATAHGPRTELHVEMDLTQAVAGDYFMGTQLLGDGAPYYYPVSIN